MTVILGTYRKVLFNHTGCHFCCGDVRSSLAVLPRNRLSWVLLDLLDAELWGSSNEGMEWLKYSNAMNLDA